MAWSYDLVAWLVSLGQWRAWILTPLPWLAGPQVLELGHGPGHLQVALHQKGVQAFGIDQSRQMGWLARRRLRKAAFPARLSRGLAQHLPYSAESFDQVVATFPSEYIVQQETLAEIQRVLQPDGLVILLPVAWIRSQRPLGQLAGWLFRVTGQAGPWDQLFREKFLSAGFVVEEKRIELAESHLVLLIASKSGA